MPSQPSIDPGFTTEGMESVFSAEATVASWLEFEAALALGLAQVGIAPGSESQRVAEACASPVNDPISILASTWDAGTPIIALRTEIEARLGEEATWFHHGATTQDAIDTGLMLQVQRGMMKLDHDLVSLAERLRDLANEFRDQPQKGRTFLQDARPTTFGLRAAGWLSSVLDAHEAILETIPELPVQLGGSNGTRSDYGERGSDLVHAVAESLGLAPSDVVWHGDRTVVLAVAQLVERVARSMAKVATDIALLSSSVVGEISVRSGGSSSMPAKENPIDSIRAIAAAAACTGAVAMLTAAPSQELDRGVGGWHVEWLAVPLAFRTAGAAVEAMRGCLESLEIDPDRMGSGLEIEPIAGVQEQIDTVLKRAGELLA